MAGPVASALVGPGRGRLGSRAATSMLSNPLTLAALVVIGSRIDRSTEPSAAWCCTRSTPVQARWGRVGRAARNWLAWKSAS